MNASENEGIEQPISKIIHIDMDAFFASVEQRDDPSLLGKPVAVGGSSKRGVVAAASYESRKFGVHSAMPSVIAYRKCPDLIFVKPRFEQYKIVSQQIRSIFHQYTDLVEPLSLDEAYLDVTHNKMNIPSATIIAKQIKAKVLESTSLIASAGISYNKFLAKMASDLDKPDGLSVILPNDAHDFIAKLPVHKFHGIGKKTSEKMNNLGIFTGSDLRKWGENALISRFGKTGRFYHQIANGIDERNVNPNRIRKSISTEDTFEKDLHTLEELHPELRKLAQSLINSMRRLNRFGKTVSIKVKYADFKQITRSKTLNVVITEEDTLYKSCVELLDTVDLNLNGIRLLGVGISNLQNEQVASEKGEQLTFDF